MKCLMSFLFLVAVTTGRQCNPPRRFEGGYLTVGTNAKGHYMVTGNMAVDLVGRRFWSSYNVGSHNSGEVLLLYNEDQMYIKTGGHCYKKKIPESERFKLQEMTLPKDAVLLKSGHIADSGLKVNVYASQEVKNGKKVQAISSLTADHCILVTTTYKVDKENSGQFNLFDVSPKIDEGKFTVPQGCQEIPPQVSDAKLSYKLFH